MSAKFLVVLAVALIVLGPEKLPGAARTAGRLIAEFRRITSGLQDDVREAFEGSDLASPVREWRATTDSWRGVASGLVAPPAPSGGAPPSPGATPQLVGPAGPASYGAPPGELGVPPGDPSLN